jgi:uncharacterized protein (TIGR03437 family)
MDAAQTNFKKIVFFLAAALLLTAPFQASAQTLAVSNTSVVIGSASCDDSQVITVTSTSTVQFTVAINYGANDLYGQWLYVNTANFGETFLNPLTAQTGPNGVQLTIGLNQGIGSGTAQATVVLTPAGGTAVDITVNYSQSAASCGPNTGSSSNGSFSVSPAPISISNSQPSQTVTIQDTNGTGFNFTPSTNPTNSWLSVSYSSLSVSANGTTQITVTGNAAETPGVGTYTGYLTITPNQQGVGSPVTVQVTFTVSNGGTGTNGGTLTVNGTNSNTAIISLDYVIPYAPSQPVSLVDTASDATSYSWQVTTNGGGNWLLANNDFSGTAPQYLAASYNAYIQISLNTAVANSLSSGAYQGSVVVTSSSGSTATITVNLYISAGVAAGVTVTAQGQSTSGAIYAFPNVAAGSSVQQQETFTVSAPASYSLGTPQLSLQSGNFIMNTPTINGNAVSFTVTSNSNGLNTGLYTATVTVPSTYNNATANTVITVVQPVGQSGTTSISENTTATVQPTSLSFQQQYGDSFWTSGNEKQAVTIAGASGTQWSASVTYAGGASDWLTLGSATSGTFGNGPATLQVDLYNTSNLAPSVTPYQATVEITAGNGQQYPVQVSLLVTPSNTPVLLAVPASTTFSINSGVSTASLSVTVLGSDNESPTPSKPGPPITAGTPTATWLSATTSGNTMTLNITNTAQTTGVYSATVPISASAYSNAINYPVVLIVNGGGGGQTGSTGPLILSSTALTYPNVTASITQDLDVTASTSTSFTLSVQETNCTNSTWLQVTTGTYYASGTATMIPVTVNPANIANGTTCNGLITLVSTSNTTVTQTVSVSMTVATASGTGNVTVTPATMTFPYTIGQSAPASQTATVVNAVSGTAPISFTVSTTENNGNSVTWLSANVSSAATPYSNLSISVAPGNLQAGTYTGTVSITPNGGSVQTIGVTMTINSNVTVTATPTTVNLTYSVGGTAPTATIQVSGGGAAAAFTATASSTGGWLQVTPTSGTTPNTGTSNLTVSTVSSALSSLLPSGTPYTGTITVTGTSPATGTTIVNVSLLVSAPLPVISGIINNASGAGGTSNVTVSPGEIISLFAPNNGQNPIGPATSVALSAATCPSPCTSVPTNMGGVTLTFLPGGYLAPLLYVSAGQINAVVPYEVGVAKISSLSVEVKFLGQSSNAFPLTLASTAPGIYTYPGSEQAAVYQYDTKGNLSYNNSSTPATAGWSLVLYLTGEGAVVPSATTGSVTVPSGNPPSTPTPAAGAPTVLFNNKTPATLSFYGEAPGFVSGLMQINVVVPPGAGTGAVPVTVTIGGNSSQAGVTVYLQ